ncbi:MAG: hypothetical protein FVQ81_07450 [Candidatus Glassbacteria bacterium]|nr:hypothetical protein [Candidatus Glassbacteria bacterium]
MSTAKVIFMGDDSLLGAAAYLGGVMTHHGVEFTYVPSTRKANHALFDLGRSLFILSDYPSENLDKTAQQKISDSVKAGSSLLMIGGWESFHGLSGEYHDGPLADILPVQCKSSDDRVNWPQGVVPWLEAEHPVLGELPWGEPPVFCGFNETTLKEESQLVLSARPLIIRGMGITFIDDRYPLLVFGGHGEGKTAALTTDLAPHWVGGWVDWGLQRIRAQAPGGGEVEVGNHYAEFIGRLVRFLTS